MPILKNFVAVDWRSGKDAIHFFFKDTNKYSRFNIGDNEVPDGYPSDISNNNWKELHPHIKNLRFGFTTTNLFKETPTLDADSSWLFFYKDDVPTVCKYDQDADKVDYIKPVRQSIWRPLLPFFHLIVAGTWWQTSDVGSAHFRFLMSDGHYLSVDYKAVCINDRLFWEIPVAERDEITDCTWPGLAKYKERIITAVQNDLSFADNYYYIFLTNNEYIRYNMDKNKADSAPIKVDDISWPGLLRG